MELKFPIWLYNKKEGGVIVKSQEQFEALKGKWVESPALFDEEDESEEEETEVKQYRKRGPKPKETE